MIEQLLPAGVVAVEAFDDVLGEPVFPGEEDLGLPKDHEPDAHVTSLPAAHAANADRKGRGSITPGHRECARCYSSQRSNSRTCLRYHQPRLRATQSVSRADSTNACYHSHPVAEIRS
jgi:hypothetical protein